MSEVLDSSSFDGENGIIRDEKGRIMKGSKPMNPLGKPRGAAWSTMLQDLAETRKRGGGGKTRQQVILSNLLERAETDNAAAALVLDRVEGKSVSRVDHTTGGESLNANISFVDPVKEIDVTVPLASEGPADT